MNNKLIAFTALVVILLIAVFTVFSINQEQEWTFVQTPSGSTKIVNTAGMYTSWWGSEYAYPRAIQANYYKAVTDDSPTDESIRVTFNDGGYADMDTMVRFATPTSNEQQLSFHREFGGNLDKIEWAVWSHLANCLKASGPLMSSSEHQTSRNGEFTQVVRQQLEEGIYEMRRVERVLQDQFDDKGKPIVVFATEIVRDEKGRPIISQVSPLKVLGMSISQFSITAADYDNTTLEQFSQKKNAFLNAEKSKAQREEEVQQRLMIEERGRREKAEFEAKALKEKASAVIDAQKIKEVAELEANKLKAVAETNAQRELEVARLNKQTAETKANQELEVAKIERMAAEENAAREVALAQAKEKSIALGGAITEKERVLAEINAQRDVRVAEQLSKIATPGVVIVGGDGKEGTASGLTENLINMTLLKANGLIK